MYTVAVTRCRYLKEYIAHCGVVHVVAEWRAGMLAGRAMTLMNLERKRSAAFPDILGSLKIRPARLQTWKALAKILLNRVD